MNRDDKRLFVTLTIVLSVLVVLLSGYLIYDKVIDKEEKNDDTVEKDDENNKVGKYTLEKIIETNIKINKNDSIYEQDGVYFLKSGDYFKIYNSDGKDITPKEIDNQKLNRINKMEFDGKFFGYTVNLDGKGYYINSKGEVSLDFNTSYIDSINNYIRIDSGKICSSNIFDGYEYKTYCTKIYDLKGNLLIDGENNNYYTYRIMYYKDDYSLFEVQKCDGAASCKTGLIDNKGNIIVDFNYQFIDYFESQNILLAKKDDNLYDIYNTKGKLLKELDLNSIKGDANNNEFASIIGKQKWFYLNDTIYLLDKNYNLKEYKDIHFYYVDGIDDYEKKYYITDYIYIKNENGIYTVHNLNGKKIIDDEFKFVGPTNGEGEGRVGVANNYIALCKNSDRTNCGAIDFKGNIIIDFENELYDYQDSNYYGMTVNMQFNGFENENQYFDIVNNKVTKKIICNNFENLNVIRYFENVIYVNNKQVEFEDGGNKIIDYNCNNLSEAKYHNIYEYGNFIVAQNNDWITYDVYNSNGFLIDYENDDNAKLTYLLGYNDGKLYFSYENAIYVLTSSK